MYLGFYQIKLVTRECIKLFNQDKLEKSASGQKSTLLILRWKG